MAFSRVPRRPRGKFAMRRRPLRRIPRYLGSRAPKVETKVVDFPTTPIQVTSTAGVQILNSIAAGADVWQRVGREAKMLSVHVRAYLQNSGVPQANEQIRMAIIYDRQSDNAAPAWSDIFQSQDNAGTNTSDSWAFTNSSNWNRFQILAEDVIAPITAGGGTVVSSAINDQQQHLIFDRYVKLPALVTRFVGAAAAVPNSGALYFVFKGLYAAMTNPYVLVFNSRVTYSDV